MFRTKCHWLSFGSFSVPLPTWIPDSDMVFPKSRELAVKRFEILKRKFAANPKLSKLYSDFMSEYLSLSHMFVAQSPGRYIIPHNAVHRPKDGDIKILVVFDASAQSFTLCPT